ncbi:hypothetical protein [Rhizobium sp. P32RR-XVIII]|uniref:hypothetical protein n=1 Tax=Rhizobium sp. P32RR-XVIII TaxID=2726738 RepID=UPI001FED2B34|nr:hypothetical protein [Rhizobium sp. P32RR-XVIII]
MQNPIDTLAGRLDAAESEGISVDAAAGAARLVYGHNAKTAVAWCAIHARGNGRSSDYSFWLRVFHHLGHDG